MRTIEEPIMLTDRSVYLNGDMIEWNQATTHLMSHSFGRGSAIFEVLSVHAARPQPAVFRLAEHVDRFFESARILGMTLSISPESLVRAVCDVVSQNGIRAGFVKILGYYSQTAFGILPPPGNLDVAVFALDPDRDLGGVHFPFETGTTACVSSWRKLDPESVPVEAKAAANYLNGMVARKEAAERGFEMVVMLDSQGFIAEGSTESVFLVCDGVLLTPAMGTILKSITRRSIIELAQFAGFECRQERLKPSLLLSAVEIFFAGTPNKVLGVRQVESRQLDPVPGPVTRRLSEMMRQILEGQDPRFRHWLHPVG
jgi:branched-chain amino acid aminotransferase